MRDKEIIEGEIEKIEVSYEVMFESLQRSIEGINAEISSLQEKKKIKIAPLMLELAKIKHREVEK